MSSASAIKHATAVLKTEPKSILKKSPRPLRKAMFFTGNEQSLPSATIYSSIMTDDTESDDYDYTPSVVKNTVLLPKEEEVDEFQELFEPLAPLQLKASKVSSSKRLFKSRPRRHQSAVYIFHQREINSEIIKILLASTDAFVKNFAQSVARRTSSVAKISSEADLFRFYREQFVDELREFLTNGNNQQKTREYANKLGASLSEPIMYNMDALRHEIEERERQRLHTVKSNRANDVISAATIDSLYGCLSNSDPNLCGSLPTASYLDSFAKELKLREIVLLKNLRSVSIKDSVRKQDSIILAHDHQKSQLDSMKERNKCIVNAASTTRKIVRFADAFGLDLERVRIITNNSFMDAFSQEHGEEEENGESNDESSSATTAPLVSKPFLVLIPLFSVRKSDTQVVKLDNYIYDYENRLIKCMVRVKNVCFEKSVFARITFNNWKSFYDLSAFYVRSETVPSTTSMSSKSSALSVNQSFDYFGFCIIIPERTSLFNDNSSSSGSKTSIMDDCIYRIEFALCFRDGQRVEHWDNNAGENYKFQCFFNK